MGKEHTWIGMETGKWWREEMKKKALHIAGATLVVVCEEETPHTQNNKKEANKQKSERIWSVVGN